MLKCSCTVSPNRLKFNFSPLNHPAPLPWKESLPILGALIATYCWHWHVLFSSKYCLACAILFARCCQERRDKEQLDIFMIQMLSSEVVVKCCLTSTDCPSQKLALSLRIDPLSVLPCTQTGNLTPSVVWRASTLCTFHRDHGTHHSPLPAYTTDDAQASKGKHQ